MTDVERVWTGGEKAVMMPGIREQHRMYTWKGTPHKFNFFNWFPGETNIRITDSYTFKIYVCTCMFTSDRVFRQVFLPRTSKRNPRSAAATVSHLHARSRRTKRSTTSSTSSGTTWSAQCDFRSSARSLRNRTETVSFPT